MSGTTPNLGLPLPSPDDPSQKVGVARIATALTMVDAAIGETADTMSTTVDRVDGLEVTAGALRNAVDDLAETAPLWGGDAGGTAGALVVTPASEVVDLADGRMVSFVASAAAVVGGTTLRLSDMTAKPLLTATGAETPAGAWTAGEIVTVTYRAGEYRRSGGGGSSVSPEEIHAAIAAFS